MADPLCTDPPIYLAGQHVHNRSSGQTNLARSALIDLGLSLGFNNDANLRTNKYPPPTVITAVSRRLEPLKGMKVVLKQPEQQKAGQLSAWPTGQIGQHVVDLDQSPTSRVGSTRAPKGHN